MRSLSRSLAVALFLLTCVCGQRAMSGEAAAPEQQVPPAAKNPAAWRGAIERAQANLDAAAQALIAVAQDAQRPREERRQAVMLLGKIGNRRSLEFLVENIGLYLPLEIVTGDGDELRQHPSAYALLPQREADRNWNAVAAMFSWLNQQRTRRTQELVNSARVLRRNCGRDVARVLVAHHLSKAKNPKAVTNLKTVQKFLH